MIYVHVPFCRSFCRYCDFYSEIACRGQEGFGAYVKDLLSEARARSEEILSTLDTNTLYIGGGTPSVMPLPFFSSLLDALPTRTFDEFTIEVNPDDIVEKGPDYARGLRSLGANRISMGVQSFDDGMLRWMGRRHDSRKAAQAYAILREAGFENVSMDLIFGVGGMSLEMLEKSVDTMVGLRPEHISAYQLSIEEGSELAEMAASGRYEELGEDECAAQYGLICEKLEKAGYRHYEISNWALPGYESRHNSAYWSREPYVGLGPGAHSLDKRGEAEVRKWNSRQKSGWTSEKEVLNATEIAEEVLMLGLRRAGGVDFDGKHHEIQEKDWFIADSLIFDYIRSL